MADETALLRSVGARLLNPRTMDTWKRFMSDNQGAFIIPSSSCDSGEAKESRSPNRGAAAEAKPEAKDGGDRRSGDDEHSLAAHDVYRQFTAMVELQLEEALQGRGVSVQEFMRISSQLSEEAAESDAALQAFLELVLGATDFLVFSDIMRDQGKRSYYFQIMGMWQSSMTG